MGTGVCWQLEETGPGDRIVIRDKNTSDAWIYRITDSLSVIWNDPSGATWLYGTLDSVLTLITCEGSFDRNTHNYSHYICGRWKRNGEESSRRGTSRICGERVNPTRMLDGNVTDL